MILARLDFSYSPYVALFFAFNGVRQKYGAEENEYVVIYAVSPPKLAWVWATLGGVVSPERHDETMKLYHDFLCPDEAIFKNGFSGPHLQFIPFPGKFNYRMHRQQGCLLYDTLNYSQLGVQDLDELIAKHKESDTHLGNGEIGISHPTAYKVLINTSCVSEVFSKLELMGINAGFLYLSADGVAEDVKNSYNYNSKTSYLRSLSEFLCERSHTTIMSFNRKDSYDDNRPNHPGQAA